MKERILKEANHIIETKDTLRKTACLFNVSKSTVHKDMKERLLYLNKDLYTSIESILEYHKEIRHIRGGQSTKYKYQTLENNI
jgi:putative DeoR family transcriptional regulator (stage III sporulation protein D)